MKSKGKVLLHFDSRDGLDEYNEYHPQYVKEIPYVSEILFIFANKKGGIS